MSDIDDSEARRRLKALVDKRGGPTALGRQAGMTKGWISAIASGKKPFRVAAKVSLEDALNLPRGYFSAEDAPPQAGVASLQVMNWDDLAKPASDARVLVARNLSTSAFALLMDSDAMLSHSILDRSIPPGVYVIIEPSHAYGRGDDVLAQLEPGARPCIRRVLVDGPASYLKALNPDYPGLTKIRAPVLVLGRVMGITADL